MTKRGISPLIATVLLIGFTVALAAVIMNWAIGFTKDTTGGVGEQNERFRLCVNELRLEARVDCSSGVLTLSNDGNINIESVLIAVVKPGAPAPVEGAGIPILQYGTYQLDLAGASRVKVQPSVRSLNNASVVRCDVQEFSVSC